MSGQAVAPWGPAAKQLRGRSCSMAMTGTVKFFNGERGYGFIKPDDGGRDVFVHITAVERAGLKSLIEGQRISFDVEPDKKGKVRRRSIWSSPARARSGKMETIFPRTSCFTNETTG